MARISNPWYKCSKMQFDNFFLISANKFAGKFPNFYDETPKYFGFLFFWFVETLEVVFKIWKFCDNFSEHVSHYKDLISMVEECLYSEVLLPTQISLLCWINFVLTLWSQSFLWMIMEILKAKCDIFAVDGINFPMIIAPFIKKCMV